MKPARAIYFMLAKSIRVFFLLLIRAIMCIAVDAVFHCHLFVSQGARIIYHYTSL